MTSVNPGVRRRLMLAREAAKFTQKEAADEIQVTRQKLGRWENGESSPSLEEFGRLCIAYGCTPAYIMYGANVHLVIAHAMRMASPLERSR